MVLARALCVLSLAAASPGASAQEKTPPLPTPTPVVTSSTPSESPIAPPSPAPSQSPSSSPSPSPSPTPSIAIPDEPPLPPDELRIRSNRQEGGQGRLRYEGFVDLRFGQLRIQADTLDLIDETQPGGVTAQRIEANGNVVFMSGTERIAGESLRLDLDTGKGMFTKAGGYLQPDVLFEAESIERVDNDTYRLKGARFTACTQPNPRWQFKARSATVEVDRKIKATLVAMQIKGVPTPLVIPYLVFPINPDQRSTGILMPRYGSSTLKGREIGLGFFWAMGRSMDQTFYYDWFTEYGIGLGHEFRFVRSSASRGSFRSYFTRQQGASKFAYDLDWSASQALARNFRATLSANFYSDLTLRQDLQDSIDYSSTRTRQASFGIQGSFGPVYTRLEADTNDIFFFDDTQQRRRRLPQLRLTQSPKKIGKTGLAFAFDATAARLVQGDATKLEGYTRIDAAPEISRPLSLPFLQVTPKALVRYTRYGSSLDENEELLGPSLDRKFFEGSVEVRGPKLFRTFRLPGDVYAERFKHTFEPEAVYTYRSRVSVFDSIPSFDYNDIYPATNQILYGVTNRVYAKIKDANGRPVTHELINWRIAQTHYFDIGASQFDPNYYSATFARGPGGLPSHKSPILSNLSIRPTPRSAVGFNLEYNPNFKQVSNFSLNARANYPRLNLQTTWSRQRNLSDVIEERTLLFNTLRGSGRVVLWPERLTVEGSASYDILQKLMLQSTARVRYGVQCCAFAVEIVNYNTRYRTEKKTTFQIELAGIGAIGNFLGDNPSTQTNGRK